MSCHFRVIYGSFIDIVYKDIIWLAVDLIIHDWASDMFEVGTDLVKATCLWGSFHKTDLTNCWVGTGFDFLVLGLGWVGACDHSLAHVNPTELMFPEPIEGLIDESRFGWVTVDEGEVTFMDFATLLHFAQYGSVFFAPTDEKKAAGFAVEAADKTEKLVGIHLAKVINEGNGAIGSGGMNQ